jgi:AraC-like DNA-binding protein
VRCRAAHPRPAYDRGLERRRAVALARHFREAEDLSIAEIADRLGRSPATIKAYFYDPTGEKARGYKDKHRDRCAWRGERTAAKKSATLCRRCWRASVWAYAAR